MKTVPYLRSKLRRGRRFHTYRRGDKEISLGVHGLHPTEALRAAGLGDADIQEGWSANLFDGSFTRDGSRFRQQSDHWAEYRVVLSRHMSVAQAARARSILTAAAPARCHLKHMTFEQAALLYNGAVAPDRHRRGRDKGGYGRNRSG